MFGQQAEQGFYIYTDMVVDGMAVNGGITKVAGEDNGAAEKNDKNSERIDKLLDIVASQQKTIELLAQKGAAADVQGVAGKAVQG